MNKMIGLAVLAILSAGCSNGTFETPQDIVANITSSGVFSSKVDLNLHPMNKTVCDPFAGGNQTQVMTQGIQGSLFYKISGMADFTNVIDATTIAKKSDKTLFFTDINVPTRMFSEGFSTQTTGVLSDDDGTKLIENFGIKFESNIQLADTDEEGTYEIATLSDDGTRLKIKDPADDTWKEIINNDGQHPTRMGCATRTVQMTRRTSIPVELIYYQGPRLHISNVMMWRKSADAGKDASCGQSGNEYFFDPNHGSVALKPFNDLLARGWKVMAPANFWLNGSGNYNPCVAGTAPVITNFALGEVTLTDAFIHWTTDIPSSTQIRFVNVATGVETLTLADNMLGTDHQVHISGLDSGMTYTAQAVSISQDLGKTISDQITFTMP
jgi:hypothetical protein